MEVGTINVLTTFANPSQTIVKVMEAAAILKGHDPKTWTWSKAKHMLNDPNEFKLDMLYFNRRKV